MAYKGVTRFTENTLFLICNFSSLFYAIILDFFWITRIMVLRVRVAFHWVHKGQLYSSVCTLKTPAHHRSLDMYLLGYNKVKWRMWCTNDYIPVRNVEAF